MQYGSLFNPLLMSKKSSKKAGTRGYRGVNDINVWPTRRGKQKAEFREAAIRKFNEIVELGVASKYLHSSRTW